MPRHLLTFTLLCSLLFLASCAPAVQTDGDAKANGSPTPQTPSFVYPLKQPVLQISMYGGWNLHSSGVFPLITVWEDGEVVFTRWQELGETWDLLVREAWLDHETLEHLLEEASILYGMESNYDAYRAYEYPTVTFAVQTPRGPKTVSAYGLNLLTDGTSRSDGLEDHHDVMQQLRSFYRAIMDALPVEAPAAQLDQVVVLLNPSTPEALDRMGERGPLEEQHWPARLQGYLSGEGAKEAARLSPPGLSSFLLLEGSPHLVQVLPRAPYIPPSSQHSGWRGHGIPFHPASLAYLVIDTEYAGRRGALFRYKGAEPEEVAAWHRTELAARDWRLAKEEDGLQVRVRPDNLGAPGQGV